MRALVGAVVLASSCAAGDAAMSSAVVNTALATTVAGVRRANGDCYTVCIPGTTCNTKSGLCDELPCRGRCGAGERCDLNRAVPSCVSAREPELLIGRDKEEPARVTPQ